MRGKVGRFLRRWGLAVACVLAPLGLGVFSNHYLTDWLNAGSELCAVTRQLSFRLIGEATPSPLKLSHDAETLCTQAVAKRKAEATPTGRATTRPPVSIAPPVAAAPAAGNQPLPDLVLVANHVAGRLNVVYGYSFLGLVSVVAFLFGSFVVIRYSNVFVWLAITVVFFFITLAIALYDRKGGDVRAIVADNILARADADALLGFMPAMANLDSLIFLGLMVGYLSVGLILTSLFVASVRWVGKSNLDGLKERMWIIRVGLILGSAILVAVVLSSRAVFDWPLSLLEDVDRKALAPAADALVRKWGAIGSIALIGAFLPAITAWYFDREAYRSLPQRPKEADKPTPDDDELEIAPLNLITSIAAVLAPIVASPLFDALKSLVAVVQK